MTNRIEFKNDQNLNLFPDSLLKLLNDPMFGLMEELKPGNLDSIVNNEEADKADQSEDSSKN